VKEPDQSETKTSGQDRRSFLARASIAAGSAIFSSSRLVGDSLATRGINELGKQTERHFQYVQMDVFTTKRLEGNQLAVFTDARGLSDEEMQGLARETNLQETTFIFPRVQEVEAKEGVKVRIFVPDEEIPFGGHPTLGTAMVLRNQRVASSSALGGKSEIVLDLKVGTVPVTFREDGKKPTFGEMRQVDPVFGGTHDRAAVAAVLDLKPDDIDDKCPIQTISTGLPFAIVPIRRLKILQSLRPNLSKVYEYLDRQNPKCDFYYICRETGDQEIGLRARSIYTIGEDPATGSAAGCTAAWMLLHGITQSDQTIHIEQGVEIKRPSHMFVRATKEADRVTNVRVGGHAVQVMRGEVLL
jgi:trans-2,3-dihydro-3-hydroxyanthranilate isomerase